MRRRISIRLAALALVGGLSLDQGRTAEPTQPEAGADVFARHDFGALDLHALRSVAVPWKLAAAALVLEDPIRPPVVSREHLKARLQDFGFLWPERLANAPAVSPDGSRPLGLSVGAVRAVFPPIKLTVANLGCAACHAGPTYDASGMPVIDVAWLGSPNTSLNLEAYTRAATAAVGAAVADEPRLVKAVRKLFPDTGFWEMASLRLFVIPEARARVAALKGAASPLPFPNGAPGLTNGVAALKLQLRLIRPGRPAPEYGFVSIPDLGDRTWRSALLVDGAYAPTGQPRWRAIDEADRTAAHRNALAAMTSFFTVPSMGESPAQARKAIPAAERVFVFLESYRPPPFPGVIDRERAIRGAEVYARACAACHGAYVEIDGRPRLASFPNWSGDVGTDPARADAFDERLVQAVRASAYRQIVDPAHTGRYAAPPLSGLWASAPYLHNGSVPTLAQFLLLEPRAARFEVGGHRLDLDTVGIAGAVGPDGVYRYPAGYRPWSQPVVIDTARPGLSNAGHVAEVERLSRDDRRDLLEYLKRL